MDPDFNTLILHKLCNVRCVLTGSEEGGVCYHSAGLSGSWTWLAPDLGGLSGCSPLSWAYSTEPCWQTHVQSSAELHATPTQRWLQHQWAALIWAADGEGRPGLNAFVLVWKLWQGFRLALKNISTRCLGDPLYLTENATRAAVASQWDYLDPSVPQIRTQRIRTNTVLPILVLEQWRF